MLDLNHRFPKTEKDREIWEAIMEIIYSPLKMKEKKEKRTSGESKGVIG